MISLADLRARNVTPIWQEAVAVVQELIQTVRATTGSAELLPDLEHIALIPNGDVVAMPGSPEPAAWWWDSEALLRGVDPGPTSDQPPTTPPGPDGRDGGLSAVTLPPSGDGLARRVPGSHLAPSLRRDAAAHPVATPPAAPAHGLASRPDREQVRSMLSRFQHSQRAARAAADPPPADSPQEQR